jgi:SAM-dependent methyltransferase
MRLGAIAENIIERWVLKSHAAPEPLLETQMAFSMARSIMVGAKLGLFEAVGDGAPRSAAEISEACATSPGATEKLLNALVGCGYFAFRNRAYALTPKAAKWLLRRSPQNLCDKMLFQFYEWHVVEEFEEFVRSGKPMAGHAGFEDTNFWNSYQRGMRDLAGITAGEVTRRFPMPPGARNMLDIGGSHGYFSVSLCRKYPELKSVILDLPHAVQQAAPILAEEKMGARVTHRPGNALTDELGEGSVDVVLMSQLVHHFTDEQNRELMKKISRALRPGGVCALLDAIRLKDPGAGGQTAALLDLYFAMLSESGTWPMETMQDWLQSAGLTPLKPVWLRTMPGGALVAGRKG